jgi:CBS domain-containing protein
MTTAKDIIHTGATCVGEHETLAAGARRMRNLGVGALPICGDDDRLQGVITDRDIIVKCLAAGHDPNATTAGELAQGSTYQVEADASIEEMLNVMEENQVRRLPVIDNHRLVSVVSKA